MMRRPQYVFLGLGANLGDRLAALRTAISGLSLFVRIDNVSSIWDTAPQLVEDQPRFLNAVVGGWTDLDPFALLHAIKRLESQLGRQPERRYGPRAIDIDILLYGRWQVESNDLIIPHPMLSERAFVLAPLAEIAPLDTHPRSGATIAELLARMPHADIQRIDATLI